MEEKWEISNLLKQWIYEMAQELMPSCPNRLIEAYHWFLQNPQEAEYLCGYGKPDPRTAREITLKLREESRPELFALMMFRNLQDGFAKIRNEDEGENLIKTGENKRNQTAD